jgi:hypothetical protein
MNQKGEGTLICVLLVLALSGLVLLCGLKLQKKFSLLEKRSRLFLCTKEAKGELHLYLKFMGQTNWAIKNLNRLKLISLIIPGLQGVSGNAEKARKLLQQYQNYKLISYLKSLKDLRQKNCPLDPRMFITPFNLTATGYQRDGEGAALLRETRWTYFYFLRPYVLAVKTDSVGLDTIHPRINFEVTEKAETLSSLWSSR